MESRNILILIDGNALVHRSYHALPPLTAKSGELVHAVYGVALTLLSVIEKFNPRYIAASFDLPGPTFRHEKFADYKATRVKAPDDLYAQIPRVKELVRAFNIPIFEYEGFEADDCVGTIARMATEADPHVSVVIVTGDNDALQLVSSRIKVFALRRGVKDTVLYDDEEVRKKFGFPPKALREYKGIRGDTSDNIPGVRGIGEKGATDLLKKYETLEKVYDHLDEIPKGIAAKLKSDRDQAFLSRELGTIHQSVPIEFDLQLCRTHDFDRERVVTLFQDLGFSSLIRRIPGEDKSSREQSPRQKVNLRENPSQDFRTFMERCSRSDRAAFLVIPDRGTLFQASFSVDIAIEVGGSFECIRVSSDPENRECLAEFFGSDIPKVTFGAKTAMALLDSEGIILPGVEFDGLLAAYLIDAGKEVSFVSAALEYLGASFDLGVFGVSRELFRLREVLLGKLDSLSREQQNGKTVKDILCAIEMPLVPILRSMERTGILLNGDILKRISREMESDMADIEQKIFDFAGRKFNVSSPKQLSEILFLDLGIPTENLRRTKTGVSTASPELQKLKGKYPIISLIEEYRERFKLKTTYLDVLPRLVDGNSRIHTTFHQASTATGRLSSSDPNLQNIPIRSVWGERIRSAFVASPGKLLIGADYSQIELRVAAHLSGDENMMEAFARGEDIHRRTASIVFGVLPEDVSDEMRRRAKVFNFGILYGMGSYGLSQAAEISREEASAFISQYLGHFSGIRKFMDDMKAFVREHGYVETELGRRRAIPEIESGNAQAVAAAERMAINMPIQGLEADIVKLAMIAVDRHIQEKFSGKASLLLQIHDELIFEADEDIASAFAHEIKRVMEAAYLMSVPLVVDVSVGKNWGEI